MKILKSLSLLTLALLFVLVGANMSSADDTKAPDTAKAPAKAHDYVGTKKCKMCHMTESIGNQYGVWLKSKHHSATANLPAESKKDTKCLVCHSTGFGKPTGYDPAAPDTTLQGVGCEACHGPGKDYQAMSIMKDKAKAIEAGLIMPEAANCKACHEGTVPEGHKERPKFDWATMSVKIAHPIPKK